MLMNEPRKHKLSSALKIGVLSLLGSTTLTLVAGPSDTIIYHDAIVKSDHGSFMVGYHQPFWGANALTSSALLVDTETFFISHPTRSQLQEIKTDYPYKPQKSVVLRHIFPIAFVVFIYGFSICSSKRKYYLDSNSSLVGLTTLQNELKSSLIDTIRFFWIKPILSKRIKESKQRHKALFGLMQKAFDEHLEHTDNIFDNLYFKLVNKAITANVKSIKLRVKVDSNKTVMKRKLAQNAGNEYVFVSRNYIAIAKHFITQVKSQKQQGVNFAASFNEFVAPPASNDVCNDISHSLIYGLNNLTKLFNLDGLVTFELTNDDNDADYIFEVESTVTETTDGNITLINNTNLFDGGIFKLDFPNNTTVPYIRPRYRVSVTADGINYIYHPHHRFKLIDAHDPLLQSKSDLSKGLRKDINLAVGEVLMQMLRLPPSKYLCLEQLNPLITQERNQELSIREKVRSTMNKSYIHSHKQQSERQYELYSNAYISTIISDDAKMIRHEIMYSVLHRFNMTHGI